MPSYTVTITDEEEKALLTDMLSIQDWLDNAIHNKARQCIDTVVQEHSDKQPAKISDDERNQIVRDAKLTTAADRQKQLEAESTQ